MAVSAALCALALGVAPGNLGLWLSALAPVIAVGGYWAVIGRRLNKPKTVRWIDAYPAAYRRSIAVAAVVALALALPLLLVVMVFGPFAWTCLIVVVLSVQARAWIALAAAVGAAFVALLAVPSWLHALGDPLWHGVGAFASIAAALCVAATLVASRRTRAEAAPAQPA